jgi:transposase
MTDTPQTPDLTITHKETYKWRHLIENYFGKLKENRGIAMRSCKTDQSFKAFISIAATIIHIR